MRHRYLIVDDNRAFAENLAEIAVDDGAEVDVALGGRRALELVEARRYDLLVTDLRMPEVDGAELLLRVRAIVPALPVLVIAAEIDEDELADLRRLGVLAVLPKPTPIDQFLALTRRYRR